MNPLPEVKSTPAQSAAGMFMDKFNQGNQSFFGLLRGQGLQFPEPLRFLFGGLATQVDKQIRPLLHMNANLINVMGSFLTLKDQVSLLQTCKSLRKDVGRKVRVNSLLSLVAQGRQEEAEKLIKKDPSLLLGRGDVTDDAGRTFTHITALQYAAWALDAHMWTMMLPHFDCISAPGSAGDQLGQLEEKGRGEHGSHFDFQPLLDAYATYHAGNTDSWSRVGIAQRHLPAHVVQEYLKPFKSFETIPNFKCVSGRWTLSPTSLRRDVRHFYANTGRDKAAVRIISTGRFKHWPTFCTAKKGRLGSGQDRQHDSRVMVALSVQRLQDLSDLLASFDIMPSQAPECKSPGTR
jgi:hypothetical protein